MSIVRVLLALPAFLMALPAQSAAQADDLAALGRALFFDVRLSSRGSQSCATCHDPATAFTDARDNGVNGAASLGDDGMSLGNRNAPALTYAFLGPRFSTNAEGDYVGGFFLDGRAATLVEQAGEPITNPLEMGLPDARAVRERLLENEAYVGAFENLMGPQALASAAAALGSVAVAISAFESTAEFASFDSRYDRYLRGELELTVAEELGRRLFFSELINCSRCHLGDRREGMPGELFTNHTYKNIGVPANESLREGAGAGRPEPDAGLLQNPRVDGAVHAGRFRVPSLRNVAVTPPYMHNGVFADLATAVHFYNQFVVNNADSGLNPETGAPWGPAEVPASVDTELLQMGQPLSAVHVGYLVAFMEALTDQRYEHLIRR